MARIKSAVLCASMIGVWCTATAQTIERQVLASSGMEHQSASMRVSSTIGEPLTQTIGSTAPIVTQGFHQPTLLITAIDEPEANSIQVYPNPSVDGLTIAIGEVDMVSYTVYSIDGSLMLTGKNNTSSSTIGLGSLPSGTYILTTITNSGKTRSFNIIKL